MHRNHLHHQHLKPLRSRMSNDAHFDIEGAQLEKPNQRAVVTVTRDNLLFIVRPHHSRRVYALPLAKVAEITVAKVIKADLESAGKPVPRARRRR